MVSSSVRPAYITIPSSRARSISSLPLPPSPSPPPAADEASIGVSRTPSPAPVRRLMPHAMLASLLSLSPSKAESHVYSLSSQTSSLDSLSLPLPASPQQASFGADVWQENGHYRTGGRPASRESLPWWSGSVSAFAPMLLIVILFPLSTMIVLAGLFSLPITASFPHNLSELANLGRELQAYSDSGLRPKAHVLGVLSVTAVWKHAWSIPGSVLLNVLAGVLMSPVSSTLLMTTLTALGSVFSSLLATPLAPVISQFFPKALALTRHALEGGDSINTSKDKAPGWVRLSVLRLIGVVPWSGINIACGVTGVALFDCLLGAFIGTLPWTAVTCQIGDIMQTVASSTSSADAETLSSLLHSPTVVIKLAILTFVSLVPILARDRLTALLGRSAEHEDHEVKHVQEGVMNDAEGRRWWFREWRAKRAAGVEAGLAAVELDVKGEKYGAPS